MMKTDFKFIYHLFHYIWCTLYSHLLLQLIKKRIILPKEERQKLEQARQNAPVLTTVGEIAGGVVSPFSKLVPMSSSPYINTVKKIPLKNVAKAGTIYGSGTAEHGNTLGETLGNYAENMGSSIVANRIANRFGEKIFGRAAFPMTRNFVEQGVGTVTEKIYNNLYKNRYNSK